MFTPITSGSLASLGEQVQPSAKHYELAAGRPDRTGSEKECRAAARPYLGEAEDFQAALSADGVAGLLVTGRGQFRARLTQVALERLRLAAVEEGQSRIAFIAVPAGMGS